MAPPPPTLMEQNFWLLQGWPSQCLANQGESLVNPKPSCQWAKQTEHLSLDSDVPGLQSQCRMSCCDGNFSVSHLAMEIYSLALASLQPPLTGWKAT